MAEEIGANARRPDVINPSWVTSLATLLSAATAVVGVTSQLAAPGSVGFATLAGCGLAVLACIVLAHQ